MTPTDLGLLEKLEQEDPAKHQCRLHHDAGYLEDAQVQPLVQLGAIIDHKEGRFLRPLCREIDPDSSGVGCAHDERYRKAIMTVLSAVAATGLEGEKCQELFREVRAIGHKINSQGGNSLDGDMTRARSDLTPEGEEKRQAIGDRHTQLVHRLFAINHETLKLYHRAVAKRML